MAALVEKSLQSGEEAQISEVVEKLLPTWVRDRPHDAATFVETVQPGPHRDLVVRMVARLWARSDPDAAIRWASTLNDTERGNSLVGDILVEMSADNPKRALAAAMAHGLPERNPALLEGLTEQWARRDPASALTWLQLQPAGEVRDRLTASAAYGRLKADPAAAAEMVTTQITPGPIQEEAFVSVLYNWSLRAPQAARAWAGRLPAAHPLRAFVNQALDAAAR